MNLPNVPAEACTPEHAKLIITFLLVSLGAAIGILSMLVKALREEKRRKDSADCEFKKRLEAKLDKALAEHDACQKALPYMFVTKQEFRDLMEERNKQWAEFNKKFEELLTRFWNHSHDTNGKVGRM